MTPSRQAFLALDPAVQAAFREMDVNHRRTGRWAASRAAARAVAARHGAAQADVCQLAGFPDRNASAAAKRLAKIFHRGED
jgi:hypothetical protein